MAERRLELGAHVVERRARVGGHERADEVEREQERLGLERREPRGAAELVAVELLLDVDRAPLVDALGVHRVAAATEVDEVEQLQVILELLVGELEARGQLGRIDSGVLVLTAGGQHVGEHCLEHREALRGHRGLPALGRRRAVDELQRHRVRPGLALVRGGDALECRCDPLDELGRGDGRGQAVETDQPAGELLPVGHRGRVQQRAVVAVLYRPVLADGAVDEPGGVGLDQDRRLLVAIAQLPLGAVAVGTRVELRRHAEVALAAGREAHVAAHAVEPEGAHVVAVVIAPDHVPMTAHEIEAVRIDRPCRLLVGGDRPVAEDDGALLRDGGLELLQPQRDLGREAAPEQPHGHLGCGVVRRVGAAEREVLEGQPQGLGIGELAIQQVHCGRERRQFGVAEVEARQEVVLLQERVELLAGEVVALRLQRHAQREQLAAIGVEAAREGLVRHLRVALDGLFDVARRCGAPLGHQIRHERELADEFVGVGRHGGHESMRGEGTWRLP